VNATAARSQLFHLAHGSAAESLEAAAHKLPDACDASFSDADLALQGCEVGAEDAGDHEASVAAASAGLPVAADDEQLADWIDRIVDRDERALEALYDATSARVLAVVQRITRRHAMSEEVVEETFWQLWRQAPRFDASRGKVITWLLAMARSRAIDALRREQRFEHDEMPDDDCFSGVDDAGPSFLLAQSRDAQAVQRALAALDPKSRQLVSMSFLRGLTHDEIAAQTATPLGSVKSIIRRSLQQMRVTLGAGHAGI
jgi:RNA polymerase sigma factor (sigma-70 family)